METMNDKAAQSMTAAERVAMRRELIVEAIIEVELEKYLASAGADASRAGFHQYMALRLDEDPMLFLGPYAAEAEAVALFDAGPTPGP